MKRSKFSEERITYALRQAQAGTPVGDICRQLGVSEATFYVWKKKYANLGVTELRELRQLREENDKLKRLVGDLSLDKHILAEVIKKSSEASPAARAGRLDPGTVSGQRTASLSVGAFRARGVLRTEHGQGPVAAAHAHPRNCRGEAAFWLFAHPRAVAP